MATELAKAYVQIVPSAQGITKGIKGAIGSEAARAGTGAGKTFGSGLVKAAIGAISAAGIGAALGKAITEGAALEQSIGGVETLFKGSADTIKKYADEAYRTAGVSANSYMEQVTSFSATLLQGLGGDTSAAAEYANKAIIQMSDNANKMGTDMSSIQMAYQGFAKDNYTMLDNLKLGYGGTQSEMARLINDSGVLGDAVKVTAETVKDVPFDQVIAAIGVIQDNLGITGTTAKEAAETLSGSAASMKAAFSNVLGKLTLGEDIKPALESLAQTTTTYLAGNLIPAVWNILKALPSGLATFVQSMGTQLATQMPALISEIQTGLMTGMPQLIQSGIAMIQQLGQGLAQGIPELLAQAMPMLADFSGTIRENFGMLVDAGIDLIMNLVDGLIAGLPSLIEYVPEIVSNIAGLINDNAPKLLFSAAEIIAKLVMGLIQNIPVIIQNLPKIIKAIVDTIMAFNWLQLGSTIIKGIANGIKNMATSLKDTMSGTLKDAANAAMNAIKSFPAKAVQWGKDMISGFVHGITSSIGKIIQAVSGIASTIAGYLHFSRPDVGPLHEYETWMPDFVDGMATTLTRSAGQLRTAAGGLARSVAGAMQSPLQDMQDAFSAVQSKNLYRALAAPAATPAPAAAEWPRAGGGDININVYGVPGQSARELAMEVARVLQDQQERRKARFA